MNRTQYIAVASDATMKLLKRCLSISFFVTLALGQAIYGCDILSIGGSKFQRKKEGTFILTDETCGGRGVYKQISPLSSNYLFYLDDLGHWIVGSKSCKNNGGIYVKDKAAVTPDKVTETWKEYKGGSWRYNSNIKTSCKDCSGSFYGPNCQKSCGMCEGGCHSYYGTCKAGCQSGWSGDKCTKSCEPGTFGERCQKDCHCLHNAPCSPGNGTCPTGCKPGWRGHDCSVHDCHLLYEREMNATDGISSLCAHVVTFEGVLIGDCQVRACDTIGNVLNYEPKSQLCEVRRCFMADMMLSTVRGSWQIYARLDADARMDINITVPVKDSPQPPCRSSPQTAALGSPASEDKGGPNAGAVVGISLFIAVVVVLLYSLGLFLYRQYKSGRISYIRHHQHKDDQEEAFHYHNNSNSCTPEPF